MTTPSPVPVWLRLALARCLEKKWEHVELPVDDAAALLAEHDRLTAEVARLQEALKRLSNVARSYISVANADDIIAIEEARAALPKEPA